MSPGWCHLPIPKLVRLERGGWTAGGGIERSGANPISTGTWAVRGAFCFLRSFIFACSSVQFVPVVSTSLEQEESLVEWRFLGGGEGWPDYRWRVG